MAEYVITDSSSWIMRNSKGKYIPTSNKEFAEIFSKKQAENVLNCSMSKKLKSDFHVEKIDYPPKLVKQVTDNDITNNTEKVLSSYNINKWLDKLSDLNGLSSELLHRKEELTDQLSEVDKELGDILHYIEFCNLNASQGYKAYKMVKDKRIKRRTIKNELTAISIIIGKSETFTDEIKKSISSMDNRSYDPRIMKELFDL